ncbi:MAG: cytochrome c4 [Burkholderiales bacterium]|nr:cytochrome c4 [Burkholderiales bacterium]
MNRTLFAVLATAALVAGIAPAAAQEAAKGKPDLAKAKQLAETVCAACHGADGNSTIPANPNLAGQGAEYISRQLDHFKSGVRPNAIMQPMAGMLTPPDMVAMGILFAQQKPKPGAAKDPALAAQGQSLFRGGDAATGVPACAACHSPNGAGIPPSFPRLAGQHAEYTLAQLKAYASGQRGADPGGKDTNGRIMATIARRMSEAQMQAVADYAAGLR